MRRYFAAALAFGCVLFGRVYGQTINFPPLASTAQDAVDAAGSSPAIVILPSSYKGAAPTKIPDNVAVWDFTKNGRLIMSSHPTENAPGVPGGLSIRVGSPGFTDINPGPNNIVGIYPAVECDSGIPCWASNPLVNLPPAAPDINVWGEEIDLNIFGVGRTQQYIGGYVTSGGPVSPSVGLWVDSGKNVAGAPYIYGFRCEATVGACFTVWPTDPGLLLTQSVSARRAPQSVTTNAAVGTSSMYINQRVSVDSGANHEDVLVTNAVAGKTGWTITGTFTKNHSANAPLTEYVSSRLWDANSAVSYLYPYHMGSIQAFTSAHTLSVLGWSANDSNGTERLYDFFLGTNQRVFRDVGTTGFLWQDRAGEQIASLSDSGVLDAKSSPGVYDAAGNLQTAAHFVSDSTALSDGKATVTLSGSAAFTSSTSYTCAANDDTGVNPIRIMQNSGRSITFKGTGDDTIKYVCAGR